MENGEEDNASLDKPDGVVTASYIIDLECCLRKGECEKALNLFEGWKKKGFKVVSFFFCLYYCCGLQCVCLFGI
jgi:pentatricopeptide repeat protein